jgi:hypothetical protein
MPSHTVSDLTTDQRLSQLAAILALGVHRYHQRLRRSEPPAEKEVSDSETIFLEVPDKPRLSGGRV